MTVRERRSATSGWQTIARTTFPKVVMTLLCIVIALGCLFFLGPKTKVDPKLKRFNIPEDLDGYLQRAESHFPGIIPGTEKKVVWANPRQTRTPLAVVYLHGFSASRQETAPLCDELSAELQANLFYTRLTGHGLSGDALAEATVNDWLNDAREALEIGKRLGERVIVIGTSTGGTLATWLASLPDAEALLACVLLSPNFALHDPKSGILTWPWATMLTRLIIGPEFSWTPSNEQQARYWTHRYPSKVLPTMMALVEHVRESDLTMLKKPFLVMYCPKDAVVSAKEIVSIYGQLGVKQKKLIAIADTGTPQNHVLAGDILSPANTGKVRDMILDFLDTVQ